MCDTCKEHNPKRKLGQQPNPLEALQLLREEFKPDPKQRKLSGPRFKFLTNVIEEYLDAPPCPDCGCHDYWGKPIRICDACDTRYGDSEAIRRGKCLSSSSAAALSEIEEKKRKVRQIQHRQNRFEEWKTRQAERSK